MIGKLIDTTTKTFIDAVGIFIAAAVVVVGAISLITYVLSLAGLVHDAGTVFAPGPFITMLGTGIVLLMGSVILRERGLTGDIFALGLTVLGVWLAATHGVLIALVPVAILATLVSKSGGPSKPSV